MYVAKAMFLTVGNSLMRMFVFCPKKHIRLIVWGLSAGKINACGR